MTPVNPIPEGYPRLSPYLCVDGADRAIDFYTEVLGAALKMRMDGPDGKVGHAELTLGDSMIMLADEYPDIGFLSPSRIGGTSVTLHTYVDDVDAVFEKALAHGAKVLRAVENRFYGDRSGEFEDPFGHRWSVASHVEDVSEEEMASRAEQAAGG